MASKFLIDIDLNGNEIQNFGIQTTGTLPASPFNGQVVNHSGQIKVYDQGSTSWKLVGLEADGTTITESSGVISVGAIAISNVTGLQTALDDKVDDSQVLTNVPAGAVFTDTTYSAGNGIGLTGTTFSVDGGDGLTQTASGLEVDSTVVRTSGAQTIAGNKTFSNDVTIQGDLTVSGNVTSKLSEEVLVEDNIVILNSNETGSPSENAGIEVERGTSANASLLWMEGVDRWYFNDGTNTHPIPIPSEYTNNTGTITEVVAGDGLTGGGTSGSVTVDLDHLGIESLTDPTLADKIMFYDVSAGTMEWLDLGSNISISNTTLNAVDTTYSAGNGIDLSGTTFSVAAGTGLAQTATGLELSHLGFEDLADPNADRIAFWDDSAGKFEWLTLGTNLAIAGTTINATNTNTQRTDEEIEDVVGAMVSSNTETGISVSYVDNGTGDGKLNFVTEHVTVTHDVASHAGGTYNVTQATLGVDLTVGVIVQVYDAAAAAMQQVSTDIVVNTGTLDMDVELPAGDWRIVVQGTRA